MPPAREGSACCTSASEGTPSRAVMLASGQTSDGRRARRGRAVPRPDDMSRGGWLLLRGCRSRATTLTMAVAVAVGTRREKGRAASTCNVETKSAGMF